MKKQATFLVEILTEELPPKSLENLSAIFCEKITAALRKENFSFHSVKSFASPRRLAVSIEKLTEQQPAQSIERRGPAVNASHNEQGNPSQALIGFARSCHVGIDKLQTVKTDKGEWFVYKTEQPGKFINDVAAEIVTQALKQLPVPKRMRWGITEFEFVRPVHKIIILYGDHIISNEIFGIKPDNKTIGHRFHCASESLVITSASKYESELEEKGFVIPDFTKREDKIQKQIQAIASKNSFTVDVDENLLNEITALVEWPQALLCNFNPEFLTVPAEVLVSAMHRHQKSFAVYDNDNNLLPFFVAVSNIDSKNSIEVVKGNERVMHARLSDAAFFYHVDLKTRLDSRHEQLKNVVYQKELGSLFDKSERVEKLSRIIADELHIDPSLPMRAALLSKCDLVSQMVGEFPELQGTMGAYYAKHDRENAGVVKAIAEHYSPAFSGDKIPSSDVGCIVGLADRLDTLVGIFGINQLPTGDKDPFGLRRAALGIIRIIIEKNYSLDIKKLIEKSVSFYLTPLPNKSIVSQLQEFINERQRIGCFDKGISADVWAAVDALKLTHITDIQSRLAAVQQFKSLDTALSLAIANKRVSNILNKQSQLLNGKPFDEKLFQHESEKILATQLILKKERTQKLYETGRYADVLKELATLRIPVDNFFNEVLVMTDDEKIRTNRLILLNELRQLFLKVADVALLQ